MKMDRHEYIRVYFALGYSQKEILVCLAHNHRIIISQRHLRRLLKEQGLQRRKRQTDLRTIALYIEEQLQGCGQLYGYRWMYQRCLQQGYVVSQNLVSILQKLLDPEGVESRRKRRLVRRQYRSNGPNETWHMDGYDKLKPFGIAISGCIDGYSRQIIWLEAYTTNNNPKVILGYFICAIIEKDGYPRKIRADRGTENRFVEQAQRFLRRHGTDMFAGERSFLYGTSVTNQRIEAWWNFLRKKCTQYYMDILKTLKEDGLFTGNQLDKELVRFCFMRKVQDDLNQMQHLWNTHKMRADKTINRPAGRPNLMYSLPELHGMEDKLIEINLADVRECETACMYKEGCPCDHDVFEVASILMEENDWCVPSNGYDAAQLYINLRQQILNELRILQ